MTTNTSNFIQIQSYSLHEFCNEIQKAVKQGYEIDFEDNACFPQTLGINLYLAGLKKVKDKENSVIEAPIGNASESTSGNLEEAMQQVKQPLQPNQSQQAGRRKKQ